MAYNTSLFAQLLHIVPRSVFDRLVRQTKADRYCKSFLTWHQCVAMLYLQFAHAKSLREISDGLRSCGGKLSHLGICAPAHSTLAHANATRPAVLYEQLFQQMLARCYAHRTGKRKFTFKNPLASLDSTTIDLCLTMFPWAEFRQTKGAVKLHLLLDHDGYLPTYAVITDGKTADITIARTLMIAKGSILVMDRGYCDYALFHAWHRAGVFFVTRLKDRAQYEVVIEKQVPEHRNILADQLIRFTGATAKKRCPVLLRRVVVWDAVNSREIELLTNHLDFGATTIAAIYKDRWEIELFFKAIKQHLRIKTFVGTSENALKVQLWTALLAILMLKYLQFISTFAWPLCRLVALLRLHLFAYRNLQDWLDDPFHAPPEPDESAQLTLGFRTASAGGTAVSSRLVTAGAQI